MLMLAVLLWSISTVITPLFAQSIPLLILCRVILGLGEGLGSTEEKKVKWSEQLYSETKTLHYCSYQAYQ